MESYLKYGNRNQRRLLTKFRISAHNLKIERGRYLRLPVVERICVLCGGNVEDEICLLLCPSLDNVREALLKRIESLNDKKKEKKKKTINCYPL